MWRYLLISGSVVVSAIQAPTLFEKVLDARDQNSQPVTQQPVRQAKATQQKVKLKNLSVSGRKVRIKSGYGGHFYANVRMNNRSVKVLVDTGATMVAINETTARKIGIRLKPSDFKYKVRTANGIAKMAAATIKEIRIGNIRVKNVRAGVSKDSALSTTLLGMSFLKQLRRFEVSGETLLLEQ
jgi:aspartyl protease family protein